VIKKASLIQKRVKCVYVKVIKIQERKKFMEE